MRKELIERFKENKGCLSAAQIRGSTFRYHLKKLIEEGKVQKARHGFYVYADYFEQDEHVMISKMIPTGVFCLYSAWMIHEISTTIPHQYHLALPRTTKISATGYPPLALHYLSKDVYELGISEIIINEQKVKCYDLERSVCDAVKFRSKVGEDVMLEVIKNYMYRSDRNLNRVHQYARMLRMERIMIPYLKARL